MSSPLLQRKRIIPADEEDELDEIEDSPRKRPFEQHQSPPQSQSRSQSQLNGVDVIEIDDDDSDRGGRRRADEQEDEEDEERPSPPARLGPRASNSRYSSSSRTSVAAVRNFTPSAPTFSSGGKGKGKGKGKGRDESSSPAAKPKTGGRRASKSATRTSSAPGSSSKNAYSSARDLDDFIVPDDAADDSDGDEPMEVGSPPAEEEDDDDEKDVDYDEIPKPKSKPSARSFYGGSSASGSTAKAAKAGAGKASPAGGARASAMAGKGKARASGGKGKAASGWTLDDSFSEKAPAKAKGKGKAAATPKGKAAAKGKGKASVNGKKAGAISSDSSLSESEEDLGSSPDKSRASAKGKGKAAATSARKGKSRANGAESDSSSGSDGIVRDTMRAAKRQVKRRQAEEEAQKKAEASKSMQAFLATMGIAPGENDDDDDSDSDDSGRAFAKRKPAGKVAAAKGKGKAKAKASARREDSAELTSSVDGDELEGPSVRGKQQAKTTPKKTTPKQKQTQKQKEPPGSSSQVIELLDSDDDSIQDADGPSRSSPRRQGKDARRTPSLSLSPVRPRRSSASASAALGNSSGGRRGSSTMQGSSARRSTGKKRSILDSDSDAGNDSDSEDDRRRAARRGSPPPTKKRAVEIARRSRMALLSQKAKNKEQSRHGSGAVRRPPQEESEDEEEEVEESDAFIADDHEPIEMETPNDSDDGGSDDEAGGELVYHRVNNASSPQARRRSQAGSSSRGRGASNAGRSPSPLDLPFQRVTKDELWDKYLELVLVRLFDLSVPEDHHEALWDARTRLKADFRTAELTGASTVMRKQFCWYLKNMRDLAQGSLLEFEAAARVGCDACKSRRLPCRFWVRLSNPVTERETIRGHSWLSDDSADEVDTDENVESDRSSGAESLGVTRTDESGRKLVEYKLGGTCITRVLAVHNLLHWEHEVREYVKDLKPYRLLERKIERSGGNTSSSRAIWRASSRPPRPSSLPASTTRCSMRRAST